MDNAIKYTKQGSITTTIFKKGGNLCLEVSDTGIGIDDEYLPHLFEPFSQEEHGYTRKFEGNGLGLALIYKFCELNSAEIFVKTQKGKGTKFTIVFSDKINQPSKI